MNIQLGDWHRLTYTAEGYTLYKTVPVKHNDGTEDTKEVIEGFYGTLEQVIRGLHRHAVQGSAVDTVETLDRLETEFADHICKSIREELGRRLP